MRREAMPFPIRKPFEFEHVTPAIFMSGAGMCWENGVHGHC